MKKAAMCYPSVLKVFVLPILIMFLLSACSSGGGGGSNEPTPLTIQGTALIPGGKTISKTGFFKTLPLPGAGAFEGATVKATSVTTGNVFKSVGKIGTDGNFKIENIPFGDTYLLEARKGSKVVYNIQVVPKDAGTPFPVDQIDSATTAALFMAEEEIGFVLNKEVNLRIKSTINIDINLIHQTNIKAKSDKIRLDVQASLDVTGKLKDELGFLGDNTNGSLNIEGVVNVNVYLTVVNILNAGSDTADESGLDALEDWLQNGQVGGVSITAKIAEIQLDANGNILFDEDTKLPVIVSSLSPLVPKQFHDDLQTLVDPETTLTETPPILSNSLTASFSFSSDQTGVTYECEVDGTGFVPCTNPKNDISNLADGNHSFLVAAIDVDGNKDKTPARYAWEVDATAPETTIDPTVPSDPSNSSSATFNFSSNETGATFECKINGGAFSTCSNPKNYTGLSEASHTFMVRATDPAGNTDETPAPYSWTIDMTGPVVSIDPPTPFNPTKLSTAVFNFGANEAAIFTCELDGNIDPSCTAPKTYTSLSDGVHTFTVSAVDLVGNPGNTVSFPWTVDTIAPDTIIDLPLPSPTSSSADFSFHSTESGSTFKCEIDAGGFSPCTSTKSYPSLADGSHTFKVKATDPAGNTDPTTASHTWSIVTGQPDTILDPGPPNPTNLSSWSFTFHSDKVGATFECRLDPVPATPWGICSSPQLYSSLSEAVHHFEVRARLGGKVDASPAISDWTVDTTAPNTVIDNPPSNPSPPPTATFHFHATGLRPGETATFMCELKKGSVVLSALSSCTSPRTYPGLNLSPPGYHFEVKGTDAAGNTDLSPATHDWAITNSCIFCEDFEDGKGTWSAENGVWQVGTPTSGTCFGGSGQCAATVLDANYPVNTDSRLISGGVILPAVTGTEEIHLRFVEWFSYASGDWGQVQVQVFNPSTGWPTSWTAEGNPVVSSSGSWTVKDVDLTAYAGQTIRIAFSHTADCCGGQSSGWFIDDIQIVKKTPVFTGDFEAGIGDWSADRGVWQVGTPTSGSCFNGSQCAATVLNANYPVNTDSRLISATTALQTVTGTEEIHLRFVEWFSYASGDWGQVQIQVFDSATGTWSAWTAEGNPVVSSSGGWTVKDVDLTAYAGQTIRIAFSHTADCCGGQSSGWFIDDIQIVKKTPVFTGDFEVGIGDWFADRGVWQVGAPTSGACFGGSGQCAATVLNANYPVNTDSRLISATTALQTVTGTEEIHLRFVEWFSYASGDWGQVQVQVFDSATGTWSAWIAEGNPVVSSSGGWTVKDVDLTAYAGQTVRIAFSHVADCCGGQSSGWFIDDIQIVKKTPIFTGDFEAGIGDWFADRGVWQVGMPTTGPLACFGGSTQCAGTRLDGNYPVNTDSRLINNAPVTLPTVTGFQTIHIRFENWFAYASGDWGQVQIQVFDTATNSWGVWTNQGTAMVSSSGGWTTRSVDLGTTLAGQTIRIAFSHNADCCGGQSHGLFIDNVRVVVQ